MNSCKIILFLFIILIICLVILFFINKQNRYRWGYHNRYENFTNLEDGSPLYQNCMGTNNNCPLSKKNLVREETPDGYKIGDDSYTCLCKCSRKCAGTPTPTSNLSSTPTPSSTPNQSSQTSNIKPPTPLGYRINSYPWFVRTR